MAIKRWNANTSQWELVGTPGTVTPAAIGAAALVGGNTFSGNQTVQGALSVEGVAQSIHSDGAGHAYRIRANASNNKAGLQFTNNVASTDWAYIESNYSGSLVLRTPSGSGGLTNNAVINLNGGPVSIRDILANGGEASDWPVPSLSIYSYDDYTHNTMLGFMLKDDDNYILDYSKWNIKVSDTGGKTTSASTTNLHFGGPGSMIFYAGNAERMRIDSSGNIGIGTNSPQVRLHAYTSSGGWNPFVFENINAGGMASVWFRNDGTSTSGQGAVIGLGGSSTGFANYNKRLNLISYANAGSGTGSAGITISMEGNSEGNQDFRIITSAGATASLFMSQSNGYLLLGYTSSNGAYRLQVNSQIFATSSSIATSDGRYKENVLPISSGLDIIDSLNPVSFDWKEHPVHNFVEGKTVGFIAQEVKEALKDYEWVDNIIKTNTTEAILDEEGNEITPAEEFLGIAESNIIPLLVAAVKELRAEVNTLKAQINN